MSGNKQKADGGSVQGKSLKICVFWLKPHGTGLSFVLSVQGPFPSLVSVLQGDRNRSFPSTSAEPVSSNLFSHPFPESLHRGVAVSRVTRDCGAGTWKRREFYLIFQDLDISVTALGSKFSH